MTQNSASQKRSVLYWVVTIGALLWGLGGLAMGVIFSLWFGDFFGAFNFDDTPLWSPKTIMGFMQIPTAAMFILSLLGSAVLMLSMILSIARKYRGALVGLGIYAVLEVTSFGIFLLSDIREMMGNPPLAFAFAEFIPVIAAIAFLIWVIRKEQNAAK